MSLLQSLKMECFSYLRKQETSMDDIRVIDAEFDQMLKNIEPSLDEIILSL